MCAAAHHGVFPHMEMNALSLPPSLPASSGFTSTIFDVIGYQKASFLCTLKPKLSIQPALSFYPAFVFMSFHFCCHHSGTQPLRVSLLPHQLLGLGWSVACRHSSCSLETSSLPTAPIPRGCSSWRHIYLSPSVSLCCLFLSCSSRLCVCPSVLPLLSPVLLHNIDQNQIRIRVWLHIFIVELRYHVAI